jgi:hypothetical protein
LKPQQKFSSGIPIGRRCLNWLLISAIDFLPERLVEGNHLRKRASLAKARIQMRQQARVIYDSNRGREE